MQIQMLDLELSNCRFTFRRGISLPLRIEGKGPLKSSGVLAKEAVICLSDEESALLYNFLGDYFMPEGVPDGA